MAGAHMATFPGALFPQPVVGNEQTVGWLFLAWRLGTAALFFSGAGARRERQARADRARRAGSSPASLLRWPLRAYSSRSPRSFGSRETVGDRFTNWARTVSGSRWPVRRGLRDRLGQARVRRSALPLVGLVLVASVADLTLSNLGWRALHDRLARLARNLVVSACLLLAFLLGDPVAERRAMSRASAVPAAYGGARRRDAGRAAPALACLDPWLGNEVPYITLYGAVAIAVWFGGLGPAVLGAGARLRHRELPLYRAARRGRDRRAGGRARARRCSRFRPR